MTQALGFKDWARRRGHQIVAAMAGRPASRSWPAFFEHGLGVPVRPLASPEMRYQRQRHLDVPGTVWFLITRLGAFRRSAANIAATVAETRPDLLVNFMEPTAGWYARSPRRAVPVLAVGHQFMLRHPQYPRPAGPSPVHWGFLQYVALTGRADARHALSYYEADPRGIGQAGIVAPPLLRDEVLVMDGRANDGHLLAYLLNAGYLPPLLDALRRRRNLRAHVFCHRPGAPAHEEAAPGVVVHALDARLFLRLMDSAHAVLCSAGFESLSEAGWLGKPTLAVPIEGHREQTLNAADAAGVGLCTTSPHPDLDRLPSAPSPTQTSRFRSWVLQSDARLDASVALAIQRHRMAHPQDRQWGHI
ncbi:MAG: glycosyltransferase family protein [Verrucomicrobiota bacterium]